MMRRTRFAENFSELLRVKGISQKQLAEFLGVRPSTVNQWAKGKREPSFYDLLCICALLDIDVKELLGYTERTKQALLRDVIGSNKNFQDKQIELQNRLFAEGKMGNEVSQACEELYKEEYSIYQSLFGFRD